MESSNSFFDAWWSQKDSDGTDVQWKHLAAAELVEADDFPLVDIGAGRGNFLALIEKKFPKAALHGVDISLAAIERKICEALILPQDLFQAVPAMTARTACLVDVIEHLPDPARLLQRMPPSVQRLVVACPNFNFAKARLDVAVGRVPFQNKVARGGHVYWCQHEGVMQLFRKSGWNVARVNHLYPRNQNRWLRPLFDRWPSLFAHEFVFRLRRCTS